MNRIAIAAMGIAPPVISMKKIGTKIFWEESISENDKNKKLSNKLYDARIRSNADNKYILVNISKKNYELRYNVLVNKSTGAVKRVSSKYCC